MASSMKIVKNAQASVVETCLPLILNLWMPPESILQQIKQALLVRTIRFFARFAFLKKN
jgi:hypothetical protein